MAVDSGYSPAMSGAKDLIALESGIDMPKTSTQIIDVDTFRHIGEFIGGWKVCAHPLSPTGVLPVLVKLIEAAMATGEHSKESCGKHVSGYLRKRTGIAHRAPESAQAECLVRIFEESC